MPTAKTYSGGSDGSVGFGIPDGAVLIDPTEIKTGYEKQIDIAKSLAEKLDDWFGDFNNVKSDLIIPEISQIKQDLEACQADASIIKFCDDAIDDLSGTSAKELARYPLDQMVSKLLYPPELENSRAAVKLPVEEENSSVAKYLPEDVVSIPTIMKLAIVKSYVKVGDSYAYACDLINNDRLVIGKAICEETALEPRSKSAMKHAAMKLASVMEQYVSSLSDLVDQIGENGTADVSSIDKMIDLAKNLLEDKTLEKKYFRAMQTSQYSLAAAKQILQHTGDEDSFNDAILKAYSYASKVLEDLPNSSTGEDFGQAGLKALKSLVVMVSSQQPDPSAIGRIIVELSRSSTEDGAVKSSGSLNIAINSLKKARKNSALGKDKAAIVEITTAIKALKILTSR